MRDLAVISWTVVSPVLYVVSSLLLQIDPGAGGRRAGDG